MKRAQLITLATFPYEWVTPLELAAYLRVDVRTVLRMIEGQSLFACRVGRHWRIPTNEARRAFPVERHLATSHSAS